MGQIIAGPGQGLQLPQSLYPPFLNNAPYDVSSNQIGLGPGDELPIPAGTWYVNTGCYCVLEFLDPVTGVWRMAPAAAWGGGWNYVKSDGFNFRVANRTGTPVSSSLMTGGSGYVQASTTVSVTGGNSTWQPYVGGALAMTTATIVTANAGAGYGVAPIVFIPPPPPAVSNPNGVGGIQATGYVGIASGTVSGFTFTNPGAGYPAGTTMSITLMPNPTDPNITTGITLATVVLAPPATVAGMITGAVCTNPGAPITPNNITLTIAGVGTQGTIVPNVMQTVTAASVVGTITGPVGTVAALLTTVGGGASLGSITNGPDFNGLSFRPRPAQIGLTVTGAATGSIAPQTGTIYDGGLFLSAPTPAIATNLFMTSNAATITNAATLTLTMGSRADFVTIQPAP